MEYNKTWGCGIYMVDNRFPVAYSVLLAFFSSIMVVLMILLFVEYRFFCRHVNELSVLKQQYSYCIDLLQKRTNNSTLDVVQNFEENEMLSADDTGEEMSEESAIIMHDIAAAEISDAPDNDDEYADDSFVVINRHPDYLKQSTLDYMQSQELNALMTAIDIDRWSDYTESFDTHAPKTSEINKVATKKESNVLVGKAIGQQKEVKKISGVRRAVKECGFIWPIDMNKFWLSSLFGPRKRIDGTWGFHHGIDMAAVKGTIVKAVRSGTVVEASFQAGYGNTVVIKHTDAIKTRYAHLHAIRVNVGQKIKQAAIVGTVGETGFIRKKGKDGSHLHFEVYEYGKRINPLNCLPRMT